MNASTGRLTRRSLLQGTAAAASLTLLPGRIAAQEKRPSASERLNIAVIGVGGQGAWNLGQLSGQNIVALCDVDEQRAGESFGKFPRARKFKDFRRMLDEMDKEIDAVLVATPDHTHAVAVMAAITRGKHVYCEKPLAHTIQEVRTIMAAARQHKVATQLGNQGHSGEDIRRFCEWIWDGAIGPVREVNAIYTNSYNRYDQLERVKTPDPVPETLDWNLWLGPAPERPYHRTYVPGKWRGWLQFGTGAIGDWVCHVVDPVFWALKLGSPTTILGESDDYDLKLHAESCPKSSVIRYEFPARGDMPPVTLTWYEGGTRPPRPADLEEGKRLPDTGAVVVGEKGTIVYGSHGAGGARILPNAATRDYKNPAKSIPRSIGHHKEWIEACKGGKPAGSNFDYGGPLTEIALLGVIAMRCKGRKLRWDGAAMKFTNDNEANHWLHYGYREGWRLS